MPCTVVISTASHVEKIPDMPTEMWNIASATVAMEIIDISAPALVVNVQIDVFRYEDKTLQELF